MENNDSNNNNKKLVDKTKKTLNEMGFDIKTGQVYELYSKILNHPSYNVAKAKNEDFEKAFHNVNFEPPKNPKDMSRFEKFCEDVGLGLEGLQKHYDYLEALERGDFKDKFFYGVSREKDGFALLNPFTDPGALYVGKMGSGKSIAMKMTLLTHMLANGNNSIYFLYDEYKGMSDYKEFFKLNNVISVINNKDYIIPVIEAIHKEMMERKNIFKECNGVLEYEKKTKTKLPRIVLALEELTAVLSYSPIMQYAEKGDLIGTIANKFRDILRVGRSYGITVLGASQQAKKEDLPVSLKSGLCMMNAFTVSHIDNLSFMDEENKLALSIPIGKSGRCYGNNDFGEIQYPYITDKEVNDLLKKYISNKTQQALTFNTEKLKMFFSNESSKEITKNKDNESSKEITKNKDNKIISLVKEFFNKKDNETSSRNFNKDFIKEQYKDKFYLGQNEENNKLVFSDPLLNGSNISLFGGMGSKKSYSAFFITKVWMANNSEKTELFLIDVDKNAGDFEDLHKYEQTHVAFQSKDKAIEMINDIYEEFSTRREEFSKANVFNFREYEKKNNKILNRFLVVIENFHSFLKMIDYQSNFKKQGTTANKLYLMLSVGRSVGVYFIVASQVIHKDLFSPELLSKFSHKMLFKFNQQHDYSYVFGEELGKKASNLSSKEASYFSESENAICNFLTINIHDVNVEKNIKKLTGINLSFKSKK